MSGIAVTFNYLSLDTCLFLLVAYLMNSSSADGEKLAFLIATRLKLTTTMSIAGEESVVIEFICHEREIGYLL